MHLVTLKLRCNHVVISAIDSVMYFVFDKTALNTDRYLLFSQAAGKSTFVRLLENRNSDWEVVPEPIARWCNVQTNQNEFEVRQEESRAC